MGGGGGVKNANDRLGFWMKSQILSSIICTYYYVRSTFYRVIFYGIAFLYFQRSFLVPLRFLFRFVKDGTRALGRRNTNAISCCGWVVLLVGGGGVSAHIRTWTMGLHELRQSALTCHHSSRCVPASKLFLFYHYVYTNVSPTLTRFLPRL